MIFASKHRGFTLIETITATLIIGVLVTAALPLYNSTRTAARQTTSAGNLRQLALANLSYAADQGTFCPAQDRRNRQRWHGSRIGRTDTFDPAGGFLADYLGESRTVGVCPGFLDQLSDASFEKSSGGYGYNSAYIGGSPSDYTRPRPAGRVQNPARTIMFATTALARGDGVQEYPYAEPFQWVRPDWSLGGSLQPSIHFRFGGKALIAWCDGHISAEKSSSQGAAEFYGGDSAAQQIGFIGPSADNGHWNPRN